MKLSLSSLGRIIEAEGYVDEGATITQNPHARPEVFLMYGLAKLQAGCSGDVFRFIPLASGDFDGEKLVSRGREFLRSGFGSLGGNAADVEHGASPEKGTAKGREGDHCLPAAASTPLILTAISIKARAARLSDLSLRNTSARSRRMVASEIGTVVNALARTSSSTLERAMKPMPASAATKRFSSSLESSSIMYRGFSLRSKNRSSRASRV